MMVWNGFWGGVVIGAVGSILACLVFVITVDKVTLWLLAVDEKAEKENKKGQSG